MISNFQPNLNHSIWIWNKKVRTKTFTGCLVGSLGTELGQSVFGGLNVWIFKTCYYGRFPYESSLQCYCNHSFSISYGEFMIKILIFYRKSAPLKLCLSGCSLQCLTYQLFFLQNLFLLEINKWIYFHFQFESFESDIKRKIYAWNINGWSKLGNRKWLCYAGCFN